MIRRNALIFLLSLLFYINSSIFSQPVVSILHFENISGDRESGWMSRSLADGLTALLRNEALILVERENLEAVIEEQKFSLSGLTDEETTLEIGRLLNTTQLIGGGFLINNGVLRVTAKITDTTTGEILFSSSVEEGAGRYFEVEKALARQLAGYYGFVPHIEDSHQTGSLTALNSYYRGLLYMDSDDYSNAAEAFQNALKEDPSFRDPGEGLEESYRFLKDFRKARYQREINGLYRRLDSLLDRAGAEPFVNYGDWVVQAMSEGKSSDEISAYTQSHPEITWGNSPVEVYWHAQNVMSDIAGNAKEYFDDTAQAAGMYRRMIGLSAVIQEEEPDDPFLPEIVYQELLAWHYLEEWAQVYRVCEQIMMTWPDYRMMWAVEDFYEQSLEFYSGD